MTLDEIIRSSLPSTLEEILAAREERAARQKRMAAAHPDLPLASFSLNIPGAHKAYPLARKAFRLGRALLERRLERAGLEVAERDAREADSGCDLIAAVAADATALKRLTVAIEESHPLGRFFDFDVIGPGGVQLRGAEFGRGTRACIVCGGPVWECARSRAHPAEELARRAARELRDFFDSDFADKVAARASRALLYEVSATPKPGLVDRANNGAHADMDIFTFIDSAAALTPFFRDAVIAGIRGAGAAERLLPQLRLPGQWAEDAMFAATGGVNTHKGLIFSLGILAAAVGVAEGEGSGFSAANLLGICGRIAAGVTGEFPGADDNAAGTHGENAYRKFGLTGARGEAALGFPAVRDHGYPALSRLIANGAHPNDAGVAAFLHLLAHVDDTNIVARSDEAALRAVQEKVAAALHEHGDDTGALMNFAKELDADFIAANLSAGGCADLLALSFMLYFMDSPGE